MDKYTKEVQDQLDKLTDEHAKIKYLNNLINEESNEDKVDILNDLLHDIYIDVSVKNGGFLSLFSK